jgi:antirestriction protein ArdC
MKTAKKTNTVKTEKFDIYQTLTDELVSMMEKGICPWRKPWQASGGIPRNYRGNAYRGANAIILALSCMANDWDHSVFLTFKQVQELGGTVNKGAKSTIVTFASMLVPAAYKGRESECPTNEKKFMLRYYRVFNICQTSDVKLPKWEVTVENDNDPIETCEAIVANMPQCPSITHRGAKACYSPVSDKVTMPAMKTFESSEAYYATLFHELSHSTGHASRLDRKDFASNGFGSDPYAFEELVAEISSCFLCGQAGIVDATKENSAGYLQNWLKVFKGDNKFFFRAASLAQKSADFILAKTFIASNED